MHRYIGIFVLAHASSVPGNSRGRSLQREEHGDLSMLHERSVTPEDRPMRETTSRSLQSASTVSDPWQVVCGVWTDDVGGVFVMTL